MDKKVWLPSQTFKNTDQLGSVNFPVKQGQGMELRKVYFWMTDKVKLRPLSITDAEKKWEEWFDTKTRRYLEYQLDLPPLSLTEYTEQLKDSCEFKDTSSTISFAIDNIQGEHVGWINIFKGVPKHGTFSFGVSIYPEHRRQGYAEDTIRLILKYGFHELRFHKCNSECLAINQESIQLHKKLGFQEEGRRRQTIFMDGKYHDIVMFGLLVDEFGKN